MTIKENIPIILTDIYKFIVNNLNEKKLEELINIFVTEHYTEENIAILKEYTFFNPSFFEYTEGESAELFKMILVCEFVRSKFIYTQEDFEEMEKLCEKVKFKVNHSAEAYTDYLKRKNYKQTFSKISYGLLINYN